MHFDYDFVVISNQREGLVHLKPKVVVVLTESGQILDSLWTLCTYSNLQDTQEEHLY